MRKLLKTVSVGVLMMAWAVSVLAQGKVVGEWTGAMTVEKKGAGAEDAETAKMRAAVDGMFASLKIALSIKADKTYKLVVKGGLKEELYDGVWSQKGNKLTMTVKKQNGKASVKREPQVFTVEKDGSFWLKFDDGLMPGKITFRPKKA